MKRILLVLAAMAATWPPVLADTIFLKSGMRLDVERAWESGGEVRYRIGDSEYGFSRDEVDRIEKAGVPNVSHEDLERIARDGHAAQERVKQLPCRHGGTVAEYLDRKADIPAVDDLGWHTYPLKDGDFQVERLMLLNGKDKLSFRWIVDRAGNISPENGKAIGITN